MADRQGPASDAGASRTAVSTREKFAEIARQKPKPPRFRNVLWIAIGVAVLAITASQLLGIAKNPVEERIRGEVAEREAQRAAREREKPPPPPHTTLDDAVPFPAGLPAEAAAPIEEALSVASKGDVEVSRRAIERLPALASAVPEDRRREVRTFLLRRLEPLLRLGVDDPLAVAARAAAAEILEADPAADPGAVPATPR